MKMHLWGISVAAAIIFLPAVATAQTQFINTPANLSVAPNGKKVGDLSPDAVYADADMYSPFCGGTSIVAKGNASALIIANGNMLFPYNKFKTVLSPSGNPKIQMHPVFTDGFVVVEDNDGKHILIDPAGKVLSSGGRYGPTIDDGKYVVAEFYDTKTTKYLFDITGKRYAYPVLPGETLVAMSEGIVLKQGANTIAGFGSYKYVTLAGTPVTKETFEVAAPFANGMAVVGKKDTYGQIKFGFINRAGELAIPYQYSNRPGDFINELAVIYPVNSNDFFFSFIDKKGKIVATNGKDDPFKIGGRVDPDRVFVFNKLALYTATNMATVFDTAGKVYNFDYFLNANKIKNFKDFAMFSSDNGGFLGTQGKYSNFQHTTYGAINLDKNFIINAVFVEPLFFDPVSKLAKAKMALSFQSGVGYKYREGFINEYGQFVIIKQPASVF